MKMKEGYFSTIVAVVLLFHCITNTLAAATKQQQHLRQLGKPTCSNNIREGSEECDGNDDTACPNLCNSDCTCPAAPMPTPLPTPMPVDVTPTPTLTPLLQINSNTILRESIPSKLFGVNIVYSWEKDDYWNGTTGNNPAAQSLSYTGNSFIRYPGGEVTSYYHWNNPVGRGWSDSWSPNFNGVYEPPDNWMSLEEYFQYLGNSLPMLGINMVSGWKYNRTEDGLNEAEALANYTRNKIDMGVWPEVVYWFLDNEQHLEKFTNMAWDETLYGNYINLYAPRIRAYFPNAKFIANWKHGASAWTQLINEAGSNIDVMDVHSYWHRNGWATSDWQSYLDGTDQDIQSPHSSSYRQYINSIKSAGGSNREVAMLEWGVSPFGTGIKPSRLQYAFIVADIFMQLIDSELDVADYWPLRANSVDAEASHRTLLDENNNPTVVWLFLQFFKEIKEYDLVQTTIGVSKVGTLAAKSKSGFKMIVYLLHRGEGSLNVRIADTDGFIPTTATAVSYYALNEDTNVDSAEWSSPQTAINAAGETTLTVKGWSLTRVTLDSTPACNNNGMCDPGETLSSCPNDCTLSPTSGPTQSPTNGPSTTAACVDKLADYTPCNHRGGCNPFSDDCCSECCSGNSGGKPKTCLP